MSTPVPPNVAPPSPPTLQLQQRLSYEELSLMVEAKEELLIGASTRVTNAQVEMQRLQREITELKELAKRVPSGQQVVLTLALEGDPHGSL